MQAQSMRKISLGLGTVALVGLAWVLLASEKTAAVRSRSELLPCNGEAGRFQMLTDPRKTTYLLDTCTGDVWAHVPSPDKLEPGAWAIMDRYDTTEQVVQLLEYLRGAPAWQKTDQRRLDTQPPQPGATQQPYQDAPQPSQGTQPPYQGTQTPYQGAQEGAGGQYGSTDQQYDQARQQDQGTGQSWESTGR